ncbi:retrovirus-related pol polyprotein from transposon TNT 1-94 [Tanacetum coccineum]
MASGGGVVAKAVVKPRRLWRASTATILLPGERRAFWSLNEDILKITVLKTNTAYPSRKIRRDLDNSTNNVLIPLDSWTSGLLVYRLPLSVEYDVSTFTGYGVSSSLSNTAYSVQLINTVYPLPLDTAYRLSGTETKIIDFRAKKFLPSSGTNPTDCLSLVLRPKIDNKDQFELKGQFLKELRENTFSGSDNEDANEHIEKVLEIVDLFHVPNITVDQLMLRVFPISLTGAAGRWIKNEPTGSIKTWEDLKTKFLNKYCPPGQTTKKMEEINNFQQDPDETLYQSWERFKELLMKCPQHNLTEMHEVILFYNGLDVPTRQILDSRGVVPTKTAADAKKAIQEMAEYSQKWHNETSRGKITETSDGLWYVTDIAQKDKNEAKRTKPGTGMERVQEIEAEGKFISNPIPLNL